MTIILGINAFHADTSVCLVKDKNIIAAIEEERINRIKHSPNFPIQSINECLKISNIKFEDITDIAINTDPKKNNFKKIIHFLKYFQIKKLLRLKKNKIGKTNNLINTLKNTYKLNEKIIFHNVEHHLSHLSSAFYASGFEEAVGLTIDGSGDFSTLVISKCNNSKNRNY